MPQKYIDTYLTKMSENTPCKYSGKYPTNMLANNSQIHTALTNQIRCERVSWNVCVHGEISWRCRMLFRINYCTGDWLTCFSEIWVQDIVHKIFLCRLTNLFLQFWFRMSSRTNYCSVDRFLTISPGWENSDRELCFVDQLSINLTQLLSTTMSLLKVVFTVSCFRF